MHPYQIKIKVPAFYILNGTLNVYNFENINLNNIILKKNYFPMISPSAKFHYQSVTKITPRRGENEIYCYNLDIFKDTYVTLHQV